MILVAVMIIVFNCFQMSLLICKKQFRSLLKKHKLQKRSTKKLSYRIKHQKFVCFFFRLDVYVRGKNQAAACVFLL